MYICKKINFMKKLIHYSQKVVFLLFAILFIEGGNSANAQYPFNFSFFGDSLSTQTVMRSCDDSHFAVYYEDNGAGKVSLIDVVTGDAITIPLEDGVHINDMCILKDTVFLCGYRHVSTYKLGCIVAIGISDFYSSSATITYYQPSYWMDLNLKRIAGFEYTISGMTRTFAKLMVVVDYYYNCNGDNVPPGFGFWNCLSIDETASGICTTDVVMEVSYPFSTFSTGPSTVQTIMRFVDTKNHTEKFHDVVVTEDYVAFVGLDRDAGNSIALHVCSKGSNILKNISSTPIDFEYCYLYPLGSNNGNPFYRAYSIGGNKIAVVTQDEKNLTSNNIVIRVIDLTTKDMIISQELNCYSHPTLIDATYLPETQKMVLYFIGMLPSGYYGYIFCQADPFSSSSTYYQPGIAERVFELKYSSLDAMSGRNFVSSGGGFHLFVNASNVMSGLNCYDMDYFRLSKKASLSHTLVVNSYCSESPHVSIWQITVSPTTTTLSSRCVEY